MRSAIWLMEHSGVADTLIGDLVEASPHHRKMWLWRQAIAAIAAALVRDIGAHPVLALRAVLVGFVLLNISRPPLEWLWSQMHSAFLLTVVHVGLRQQLALMAGIVRTILWAPASFGAGWLVARLHRSRTPAMVFTFLAVTWFLAIPSYWHLSLNAIDHARFRPYLAVDLFGLIVFNATVVAGALWGNKVPVLKAPDVEICPRLERR